MVKYYIKTGDCRITQRSILTNLKYLSKKYKIKYKALVTSIDNTFTEPITFTDCVAPDGTIYYNLPNITYKKLVYTQSTIKGKTIDSVVNNACILAIMNNENYDNIERMRYYILEIAGIYMNNKTLSTVTVNELLEECCCNLIGKIMNNTIEEEIKNQCIKNCRHKVVTKGPLTTSEKKSLSHIKFNYEERNYVIFLYGEGYSYRAIMREFEAKYDKKISLYGVQSIIKSA